MISLSDQIYFGVIGGLVPDMVRLARNRAEITSALSKIEFYLSIAILAVLGAMSSYIFDATTVKEAVAFGIAAPALLSNLGPGKEPAGMRAGPTPRGGTSREVDSGHAPYSGAGGSSLRDRLTRWWDA